MKTTISYSTEYLLIGDVVAVSSPHLLKTVLGSCISTCIWDKAQRFGSMNHFIMPAWNRTDDRVNRYGDQAVHNQIELMYSLKCRKKDLVSMIFGGGQMICSFNKKLRTGDENYQIASDILSKNDIMVVQSDVGGPHGRHIEFNTHEGSVILKRLGRMANTYCPNYDPAKKECILCGGESSVRNSIDRVWKKIPFVR